MQTNFFRSVAGVVELFNSMELTDDVKERIKFVVKKTGLSQREFSEKMDYSSNKITEILKGSGKTLSNKFVRLLERHYGVNSRWLETGVGSPCSLCLEAKSAEEQELLETFRFLDQHSKNILYGTWKALYEEMLEKKRHFKEDDEKQQDELEEWKPQGPESLFEGWEDGML